MEYLEIIAQMLNEGRNDEEIGIALIAIQDKPFITTSDGMNPHFHEYDRETKKTTTSEYFCSRDEGDEHVHNIDIGDGIALPVGEDEHVHTLLIPAIDDVNREGLPIEEDLEEVINDIK